MEVSSTQSNIENLTIGRPIVNANIGVTNMIESNDIYSIMLDTFTDIVRVLSDHCGPYGKFAMITSATNRIAEPVFTKDGIGIVRAMEYMSVMQEYVRNTLAYMGSRIETAAGDGTTSSMIICAEGLYWLLRRLEEIKQTHTYSYTDLVKGYESFSKKLENVLDKNKYTLEKLSEGHTSDHIPSLIYRIAYAQAYTSSHGDEELSDAVATLFAETPKEAWNYLSIEKAKYESDKKYEVVIDESQFTSSNVRIYPQTALTDDMGTARKKTGALIYLSPIAPTVDDTFPASHDLYEKITNAITDETHPSVTFICSKDVDAATLNKLNELFFKYTDNDVVLFLVDTLDPRINDVVCMQILNNKLGGMTSFVGDYEYIGSELKIIKGLYENPDNSKLNPMINDPKNPFLNEMLSNIDKIIQQIQSQTANRTLNEQVANLKKLRLKMLVSKRTYFRIGGNAYDVAAATDVVLDAILAVKHSLTQGFCLGGNKTLCAMIIDIESKTDRENKAGDFDSDLELIFCEALCRGIETVFKSTVKWFPEDQRPMFDCYRSQNIANHETVPIERRTTTIDEMTHTLYLDKKDFIVPIIQPVSADFEIIKRFGELALKFVRTVRIITPGGLVTNKKIDTL